MPKSTIAIGYVHPAEVSAFFMSSLIRLLRKEGHRIGEVIGILSGPKVDSARNTLFREWLTNTKASRLLMVDTDMVLPDDTISRLISHNKDIVGGLAFTAGMNSAMRPTLHVIREGEDGLPYVDILWDYPPDSLVEVDGTGGACLMVTRKAAQAVWDARGEDHKMPWFAFGMHNGVEIGEDIGFCLTAQKVGFKTYVDTGLIVGHIKPRILGQDDYVRSLMQENHPYYTRRGEVPIYQDLTGDYSSLNSDQPDPQRLPGI